MAKLMLWLLATLCYVASALSLTCNDLGLLCPGTVPRVVPWTTVAANIPSTDGSAYNWNTAAATPFTGGSSTVECEERSDHLVITSTGIPSNASYVGLFPFRVDTTNSGHNDNPNTMSPQSFEWKIPKTPTIKSTVPPQATSSNNELQQGPIGFALDGVPFFNPFNREKQDAVDPNGGGFEVMDLCYGHPTMMGAYHHHFILPKAGCLFQDTPGQHSPKIGYAFDGIPIYGPLSDGGVKPTDLDACSGRTHPTLGYIYHTTGQTYPYTFGCYRYQTIQQRMIQGTLIATDTNTGVKGTLCSPAIRQPSGGQPVSSAPNVGVTSGAQHLAPVMLLTAVCGLFVFALF